MAKRDRDTSIWKDNFYRSLPPLYKCFWDYINDDCDNAGVWLTDFKVASIQIGRKINPEKAIELFGNRIQVFDSGNKWHIKTFISDKLGFNELDPKHKFQKSIMDLLAKHKIEKNGLYPDTLQSVKEREGQEKGKDVFKINYKESEKNSTVIAAVEILQPETFQPAALEENLKAVYTDQHREDLIMTFRDIDVDDQWQKFQVKVRGSPKFYRLHNSDGLRLAFNRHLQTAPKKHAVTKNKRNTIDLASGFAARHGSNADK